jgi:hypothetical protein
MARFILRQITDSGHSSFSRFASITDLERIFARQPWAWNRTDAAMAEDFPVAGILRADKK